MPDAWEVLYGLDPLNPSDATLDPDNDGVSNLSEFTAGTHPRDGDNDGVPDLDDAFPADPTEWADADGDGLGDNVDLDDDNDGAVDASDAFPNDSTESVGHRWRRHRRQRRPR